MTISQFRLEYSETGEDGSWVTIQEYKETDESHKIEKKTGLNINARYVRLRLTKTGTTTPNKAKLLDKSTEFTVNKKFTDGETYLYKY